MKQFNKTRSLNNNSINFKSLMFMVYIILLIPTCRFVTEFQNSFYLFEYTLLFALPALKTLLLDVKFRKVVFKYSTALMFFYIIYFTTFYYKEGKIFSGYLNSFIFIFHIIIISYFLYENEFFFKNSLVLVFNILSIFFVFIPHYKYTNSLTLGNFYNLLDEVGIFNGTLEAPSIVAICLLLNFFVLKNTNKKKWFYSICILFSIFQLLLFSRRGLIFSSLISIIYVYIVSRNKFKISVYWQGVLIFVPFLWNILSPALVIMQEMGFFSIFTTRNDLDEIKTATGRLIAWQEIISLILSFDSKYILGYWGELPQNWFLNTEDGSRYAHAHNTFLQLFVEGGYMSLILLSIIILKCISNIKKMVSLKIISMCYSPILFTFFLTISGTESLLRGISFLNFFFIIIYLSLCFEVEYFERSFIDKTEYKKKYVDYKYDFIRE
ncbi:O-antigen ligase family protein [Spirosoma foliorum]|uniref:O-antigen ligase family protein n=1 Tax=Spirosoma foliorum TaxID=2710596 RepID=A0A7G5H0E2_9BACT|nr:O-antigen ligase family protein [Spirosoma foliorum]QMW04584.1 O-antigen ligase family protein [Spirosoma foliorum]